MTDGEATTSNTTAAFSWCDENGVTVKQLVDDELNISALKCADHALIFALTGVLDVALPDGTKRHLLPEQAVFHAAGEIYSAKSIKANTYISVAYPTSYLDTYGDTHSSAFAGWHSQIITGDNSLITLINMIDKEISNRDHHSESVLRLVTQQIAIHLVRNYSTVKAALTNTPGHTPGRPEICQIMCALEYIESNLTENTSLSDLLNQTQLSKHRFLQTFKEITGLSPQQYMIRRRLETAKHLLRRPDLNLEHIARRTGFVDQSHFSKAYRKFFGQTPALFRRN